MKDRYHSPPKAGMSSNNDVGAHSSSSISECAARCRAEPVAKAGSGYENGACDHVSAASTTTSASGGGGCAKIYYAKIEAAVPTIGRHAAAFVGYSEIAHGSACPKQIGMLHDYHARPCRRAAH